MDNKKELKRAKWNLQKWNIIKAYAEKNNDFALLVMSQQGIRRWRGRIAEQELICKVFGEDAPASLTTGAEAR